MSADSGFVWAVTQDDQSVVALQGQGKSEPLDSTEVGGRVQKVFTFVVTAPGMAHLEISLRRPWQKDRPPARVFKLDVRVP